MKLLKSIGLLLFTVHGFAQEYTAAAKLSGVGSDGIYRIPLDPNFRSFSDANPVGIRILDKNNGEVPYFMERLGGAAVNGFERTKILSTVSLKDSVTSIVIENPGPGITLAIANSDVVKTYSISGSNDQGKWYGLRSNQVLDQLNNAEQVINYKTFSLPVNDYRYIRFDFDDRKTLPIHVVAAGVSNSEFVAPLLNEAAGARVKISQISDRKVTRISIRFGSATSVDRIAFSVTAPKLYKREAALIVRRSRKQSKKIKYYDEVVQTFQLSAGSQNTIDLTDFTESEFFIDISNDDNPPLTIESVMPYQVPVHLVAELKAGQSYRVMAGDANVPVASYDLINFKDNLPQNLPVATLSAAEAIAAAQKKSTGGNAWIMWVCIGAGALVVGYFTVNMVRDMKKQA